MTMLSISALCNALLRVPTPLNTYRTIPLIKLLTENLLGLAMKQVIALGILLVYFHYCGIFHLTQ